MNRELDILCYNLKFLKIKHNLTQEQLAKIGNIDTKSMAKLLHRQIPPNTGLYFLSNIAEHFNLKIYQLFMLDFGI